MLMHNLYCNLPHRITVINDDKHLITMLGFKLMFSYLYALAALACVCFSYTVIMYILHTIKINKCGLDKYICISIRRAFL